MRRFKHHKRLDQHAAFNVRLANHGALRNCGVFEQRVFNFRRANVVT